MRLPRRGARRLHGQAGPRRRRHRRRRGAGRLAGGRRAAVLRARPARAAAPRRSPPGGCSSPPTRADAADADVHFICVGTPQKQGENAADLRYVHAAVDDLLPHLSPGDVVVGKSTVPVGTAELLAERIAETRARGRPWSGTRSSSARGTPSRTRCDPDRFVYGARGGRASADARGRDAGRGVRRGARRAARPRSSPTWPPPSWSRSRRTRSWPPRSPSSTRWPSCARRPARDVTMLADAIGHRRADRPQVPQRRGRLRRRLPAQGHPGLHGAGRRARRRPGADRSCARSTRSTCAAGSGWSTWPARSCGGSIVGPPDRGPRRRVQAGQRRRARLTGAERRRPDAAAGGQRHGHRPAGHRQRPRRSGRTSILRRHRRGGGRATPSWCWC